MVDHIQMKESGVPLIVSENSNFSLYSYKSEKELEKLTVKHSNDIFGNNTFYIDIKKKLVSKKGISGVPDGFLLDFGNNKLYIVEIELSSHDIVSHISNQLIRFKAAMRNNDMRTGMAKEFYGRIVGERTGTNLEDVQQIMDKQFGIIIVIDSVSEQLTEIVNVLAQDGTEVLAIPFETYVDSGNNTIHRFTAFNRDTLEKESGKWSFKWTTVPLETHLDKSSDYMKETFSSLSKQIRALPNVKEKSRKGWVTYQTSPLKNFCTVKILSTCLEVHLKCGKIFLDDRGITKSIKRTPSWTFDRVFTINSHDDVNYALRLITQAYECICQK